MTEETITRRGRARAEAGMVDTCTIRRLVGSSRDSETGVITPTYAIVYSGRCKVQQQAPAANPQQTGEAAIFLNQLTLHLPVSVTGPRPDDEATIDAAELDPDLAGRVFHLRGPAHKTFATARRYPIVEATG